MTTHDLTRKKVADLLAVMEVVDKFIEPMPANRALAVLVEIVYQLEQRIDVLKFDVKQGDKRAKVGPSRNN